MEFAKRDLNGETIMSLVAPNLDDRTFQQLVDEAKKRIPYYTEAWTDHNVSDPGITLIELFAWLTEATLYRMNRVPERHYIKFMEMFGIRLKEPVPARVPVTFWLSAGAAGPLVLPKGTEVASTQTETQASIVFTTDEQFALHPPDLTAVFSWLNKDKKFTDELSLRKLRAGFEKRGVSVFASEPAVDDALYLGFSNDISHHILRLDMSWESAGGTNIAPDLPPVVWEGATGGSDNQWLPCDVEIDTTRGFNSNGRIQLHIPKLGIHPVNGLSHYWVRVRHKEISATEKTVGMRPYESSPQMNQLTVSTWGGSTMATHAQSVKSELLGISDGTPGQSFFLKMKPILTRQPEEQLLVRVPNGPTQSWHEVDDFADAQIDSRHYTLDSQTGEVRFGPAVRQPNGDIKLYGAIPGRGAVLVFNQYRYGGGNEGNIEAGVLNTLKTAIPYVNSVRNRQAAEGGLDAETLEDAMVRAPKLLRHRERAVTAEDYEDLALQTPGVNFGRVKCLQPLPSDTGQVAPGQVYILVIPRVHEPFGYIAPEDLEPKDADIDRLKQFLDQRRLITTRLFVNAPAYRWVAAQVQVRASIGMETAVSQQILSRLYQFLNPLVGGANGMGWPFGRELFVSDVYQCLQGIPDVQFIRSVTFYVTSPGSSPQGEPEESVKLVEHGMIVSGKHEVVIV